MLDKVKKYVTIATIAILLALFSLSIVDVVIETPNYEDFCKFDIKPIRPIVKEETSCPSFKEPTDEQIEDCSKIRGNIEYSYDELGCPADFKCNTCNSLYEDARKQQRLIGFIITSVMGIIAIIIGLFVKSKKEAVEWVYSGILIGGILSIFIGTASYFHDMGRFVKPFVLLAEIILVILIVIKTANKINSKSAVKK